MQVGIPKETLPGETRVAAVPDTVKRLVQKGLTVRVEAGAGERGHFTDAEYVAAGAQIEPAHEKLLGESDLLLKIQRPAAGRAGRSGIADEVGLLKPGSALIAFLQPFSNKGLLERLAARGVTAMAMELMPRITRAQNMDALSSMATVAGYKAVVLAAAMAPRFFPMLITAAGTVPAARALILGAGVAGLQAIATARRLGASVEAFDVRPAVKEQVLSLGAKFLEAELSQDAEDKGGYAKALSAEQHQRELALIDSRMPRTDIVVSTAAIPGQKAPILITKEMVGHLRAGSVIVDLAAEGGGNCELTDPGNTVVREGVTIVGTFNVPALMPTHASQMYSKNLENLVLYLLGKEGWKLDFNDPITSGVVATHGGKVVHPALKSA